MVKKIRHYYVEATFPDGKNQTEWFLNKEMQINYKKYISPYATEIKLYVKEV